MWSIPGRAKIVHEDGELARNAITDSQPWKLIKTITKNYINSYARKSNEIGEASASSFFAFRGGYLLGKNSC